MIEPIYCTRPAKRLRGGGDLPLYDVHPPPLARLRRFARYLGWPDLVKHTYRVPMEDWPAAGLRKIIHYEAGDFDSLLLQINVMPISVAVYALRYRLVSGWFAFQCHDRASLLKREADRLAPWVHFRHFADAAARRAYRRRHPECAGYSWRRIREESIRCDWGDD